MWESWTRALFKEEECPVYGELLISDITTHEMIAAANGVIKYGYDEIEFTLSMDDINSEYLKRKISNKNIIEISANEYMNDVKFQFKPYNNDKILYIISDRSRINGNLGISFNDTNNIDGSLVPLYTDGKLLDVLYNEKYIAKCE